MSKRTQAQELLRTHLRELGIETEAEYKFDPARRWRFDLCSIEHRMAFECDGGKWHGGHRRGNALEKDYDRQNTAIMAGWRLLRFTNEQILTGKALEWLREHL